MGVLLDQEELALVKATKPDDWQSRIGGAIISSAVVGAGVGAIEAFWTDVPAVKKEAAGPALRATANVIKNAEANQRDHSRTGIRSNGSPCRRERPNHKTCGDERPFGFQLRSCQELSTDCCGLSPKE